MEDAFTKVAHVLRCVYMQIDGIFISSFSPRLYSRMQPIHLNSCLWDPLNQNNAFNLKGSREFWLSAVTWLGEEGIDAMGRRAGWTLLPDGMVKDCEELSCGKIVIVFSVISSALVVDAPQCCARSFRISLLGHHWKTVRPRYWAVQWVIYSGTASISDLVEAILETSLVWPKPNLIVWEVNSSKFDTWEEELGVFHRGQVSFQ